MSIALSGKISFTPLHEVLEQLRKRKATGTLTVCSSGIEKSIYVKDGQIIFATSTDGADRLGESLVRSGKLTRDNLDKTLRIYAKGAGLKKLGAILVENGHITPKDLFSGLKVQVKDIIFSLFLWPDGEYRFEDSLPSDVIHLHINIKELIAEIIQRMKQET
jgi:Domain of unknown function (DUF4388)